MSTRPASTIDDDRHRSWITAGRAPACVERPECRSIAPRRATTTTVPAATAQRSDPRRGSRRASRPQSTTTAGSCARGKSP